MSKKDPASRFAENPFSGDFEDFYESPQGDGKAPSMQDLARMTTKVTSTSLIWFAATIGTSIVADGGAQALKREFTANPASFAKGVFWTLPYNLGIAHVAADVHKKMLDENHVVLSAFGGATAEAAVGNPFDMISLGSYFHTVKLRSALRHDPEMLPKFSTEELRRMMPKFSPDLSREQLLESAKADNYSQITFTGKTIKLMAEKTGVRFTMLDFAKINGLIFLPSIFRNFPAYLTMGLAHQSSQNGEGINWGPSFAISAAGSALTLVPNTAIYQTGNNVMKGMASVEALKSAFLDSAKSVVSDPRKTAILFAIRTAAIFSTSLIFTPHFDKTFNEAVDAASDNIAKDLGIEESLSDFDKKEIDSTLQKAALNPDPKLVKEMTEEYEKLLEAECVTSKQKPRPITSSAREEKLSKTAEKGKGASS